MTPGRTHTITASDAGQRLERWLRRILGNVPRTAIFKHLREGRIRVDGGKADGGLRLAEGMQVELRLPAADLQGLQPGTVRRAATPHSVFPAAMAPTVLFGDDDVLFVDKPAGLAAQPGTGVEQVNLLTWLDHRGLGQRSATFAPAPVHRLDRGTSGIVAIGLSPAGARGLAMAFRDDQVDKYYAAVVHGVPGQRQGSIDAPLREVDNPRPVRPRVVVDAVAGRPARTDFEVVAAFGDTALLRLRLFTGRLHQIRAHLLHLGHPIVGDARYGSPMRRSQQFLLHAVRLCMQHPCTGQPLDVRAPLPRHFGAAAKVTLAWA